MKRREFFLKAIKAGQLKRKDWIFHAFTIMRPVEMKDANPQPFDIVYHKDGVSFFNEEIQEIQLEDYQYDPKEPKPVYHVKDKVNLKVGDLENVFEDVKTTYGNVLTNWLLCVYPFGQKIPYFKGRFSIGDIEKAIEKKFADVPEEGERDPDKIYYDEYEKYRRAAGIVDGLTQICTPSATPKSMTHHPDRDKVRDALLEKYKDQLHDPAVAAKIQAEMKKLDMEWLEGDRFKGFLIKGKTMDVVRMKTHGTYGLEQSFTEGEGGTFIPKSLSEGWDISQMPALANSIREGSFDRGAQTALGGEATKFILRVMQNALVKGDDCGTKLGMMEKITEENKSQYIGNHMIQGDKLVVITDDNIASLVGKTIKMRSPAYCRTANDNVCKICVGQRYADSETGLATAVANVGSTFMSVFMSSMHGKSLTTVKYNFEEHLT